MNLPKAFCGVTLLALGSGCDSPLGGNCPDVVYPGIEVSVSDAATGLPTARGVSGIAWAGDREFDFEIEPETPNDPAAHVYAFVPAGLYAVELRKSGYQDWTAENVRVRRAPNGCYNETARLQAALEPSAGA